ncbi:MAG TPA: hypothetical protein VMT14_23700 [Burkholderiaceae bacterium]|nr:hypothetical protein [Burkholderiaceae bacterium]
MAKATVIGEFPAIASKTRSALRIVPHSGVRSRRKLMPALGRKLTITNDRSRPEVATGARPSDRQTFWGFDASLRLHGVAPLS